jgi:hypothetical protein
VWLCLHSPIRLQWRGTLVYEYITLTCTCEAHVWLAPIQIYTRPLLIYNSLQTPLKYKIILFTYIFWLCHKRQNATFRQQRKNVGRLVGRPAGGPASQPTSYCGSSVTNFQQLQSYLPPYLLHLSRPTRFVNGENGVVSRYTCFSELNPQYSGFTSTVEPTLLVPSLFLRNPKVRHSHNKSNNLTCYGLEDRGSINGTGRVSFFATASTPALGPTQPLIQRVPGVKRQSMKMTTHFNLVQRLRIRGAIPPTPPIRLYGVVLS